MLSSASSSDLAIYSETATFSFNSMICVLTIGTGTFYFAIIDPLSWPIEAWDCTIGNFWPGFCSGFETGLCSIFCTGFGGIGAFTLKLSRTKQGFGLISLTLNTKLSSWLGTFVLILLFRTWEKAFYSLSLASSVKLLKLNFFFETLRLTWLLRCDLSRDSQIFLSL